VVLGYALGLYATGPAPAQPASPEDALVLPLPTPQSAAPAAAVAGMVALPWGGNGQAIALPAALRLAETANLDIAIARTIVDQAEAVLLRAKVTALPNFNLGSTYSKHEGSIAKTEGNIIDANKDAVFVGGGPSLAFGVADALFTPLVARQALVATQAGLRRVNNDVMLAVADAYLTVLRARRRLARVDEVLDYLVSEQPSPGRAGAKGLLPVVKAVQEAGGQEALRAEVERVRVEALRRQEERDAAIQDYLLATAELARLLRLDPQIPLWPAEDYRYAMPLPGASYGTMPMDELVRVALNNRPELAENQALVAAAVERVRTARYRPLLPNVVLNYNWGDFGGGPDPNTSLITPATKTSPAKITTVAGFGPSGEIHHMTPRADFDVSLVWRLQNMGFGNRAEIRENQALARQASLRLLQVQDRVVTQVVQAKELVDFWKKRVEIAGRALFDARGQPNGPVFESLVLNFRRIREVEKTRPLEVLDSIRGLNDVLETYAQAVTDYERARFRLLVALGLPPENLIPEAAPPKE
jgi:outer membrane protein TolC